MLPADEAAFGAELAQAIAELARWETHNNRTGVHSHESLEAALRYDGVQAFLRLLGFGGGSAGPLLQYLTTSVKTRSGDSLGEGRSSYRTLGAEPETMSPGRLAFKWFPEDEPDCVQRDFPELAGLAWKALQRVTAPHLESVQGKPLRGYRIGAAAKDWALNRPGLEIRDGGLVLRIRSSAPATSR